MQQLPQKLILFWGVLAPFSFFILSKIASPLVRRIMIRIDLLRGIGRMILGVLGNKAQDSKSPPTVAGSSKSSILIDRLESLSEDL